MIPLSLRQIAEVVGGEVRHSADPDRVVIHGDVVTDSRAAQPGSLYVARVGEHADGHDFIASAVAHGAVAALVSHPVDLPIAQVAVPDVQEAFAAIAREVIEASPGLTVIGVTGSSGKTSTKDLLGQVLAIAGPTIAPEGSYNSEVGVPLTVCRVRPETQFLVVEMGARGIGHIAYLAAMAPPRIGVVLNVGTAHVGEFGGREAIATAKSELPQSLPSDGVAVLNADDPAVAAMATVTRARVVLVGEDVRAHIRAEDVRLDPGAQAAFTLVTPVGSAAVQLGLAGRHHVGNALAVVAVALECGLALADIVAAIEAAVPISRWRMEVTTRDDGVMVINDAYNANPDSMSAALAALAGMAADRRIAVLGTMLELGAESDAGHAEVGRRVVTEGIDELLVVGRHADHLAAAAEEESQRRGGTTTVRRLADAEAAERVLRQELGAGDVVLFKSSRDAGLRWLGDRIAGTKEDHS